MPLDHLTPQQHQAFYMPFSSAVALPLSRTFMKSIIAVAPLFQILLVSIPSRLNDSVTGSISSGNFELKFDFYQTLLNLICGYFPCSPNSSSLALAASISACDLAVSKPFQPRFIRTSAACEPFTPSTQGFSEVIKVGLFRKALSHSTPHQDQISSLSSFTTLPQSCL